MKNVKLSVLLLATLFVTVSSPVFSNGVEKAISNLRHQVLDYPQEKLYIHMNKPSYMAGDTIWFRGHTASEAFHLPSALSRGIFVHLSGPDGKIIEKFALLPMDKRLYSSFLVLPEYLPEGEYTIKAYTERMQGKRSNAYFIRKFWVTNPVRKYSQPKDLKKSGPVFRFYPEGDKLLDKQTCDVAFTANDASGTPCDATVSIFEDGGSSIAVFKTIEPGIGRFSIPVEAGKSYHALVEYGADKPAYVDLPIVQASGYNLKVADMVDSWYVSVLEAGSEKLTAKLEVLLLVRGVPNYHFELSPEKDFLYIPKIMPGSGVHQLVLLDEQNKVLSERLIFANNPDQANIQYELKKPAADSSISGPVVSKGYTIDFSISDASGKPLNADFSVAIYPDNVSGIARVEESISSDFLLASDLNISLPNAERFLDLNDAVSQAVLDAWLIVARWPKFDVQRAIDGLLESSWDIGEKPEENFIRDTTGIYGPLTADEKSKIDEIKHTIDLKAVNITAEQIDKNIKPYSYVNHTVTGQELVEQGLTIQDYLVRLPGVTYDYAEEIMLIRNGNVTFLLDGIQVDDDVLRNLPVSEIESIDVLKDPGNMGLIKFSAKDSSYTGIGGVVAIWTKRAIDIKPRLQKNKVMPAGKKINDDVRRMIMPGTEDTWLSQFPNISGGRMWKPCVLTDAGGKAKISFVPSGETNKYILEINGISFDGSLISLVKVIELP